MSLAPGDRLGPYEVQSMIGAGGMGEVYKARDTRLDRTVAIKVLPQGSASSPERRQRFEREARTISGLAHPHICTLYDVGEHGGRSFLVMEHLVGETLADRLKKGALPVKQALEFAIQIAEALDTAHKQGIVHRDLKPANVMLTRAGAKLLDFGLAIVGRDGQPESPGEASAQTRWERLTEEGTILGTLAYMAPEQLEGRASDARSDLWAFGAVLHEMVTGKPAFEARSPASLAGEILHRDPAPLTATEPLAPLHLERIVKGCLTKDPEERRQSAHDLLLELRWLRDTVVQAPAVPQSRAPRVRPLAAVLLLLLGMVVIVGAVYDLIFVHRSFRGSASTIRSVAVLPFRHSTSDASTNHLCDTLTENIINGLTDVPSVHVKSWQSVAKYRDADQNIETIAKELDVDTLVMGRLNKIDDRLFISIGLIDVGTSRQLWGYQYQMSREALPSIQERVSEEVNLNLRLTLSEEDRSRLETSRLFQKGRYYLERRQRDDLHKAVDYFGQVVERDPKHARAHAGLANSYSLLSYYGGLNPSEAFAKAKANAEKALELDETLAEAHTALGLVKRDYDRDWQGAELEFTRALQLNPDYETAHQWYAEYLTAMGRFDEALEEIRLAQKIAPTSLIINATFGWVLYCARRTDDAIRQLERTLLMDPQFPVTHWFLGWAYEQKGAYDRAVAELRTAMQLAPTSLRLTADLGHVLGSSQQRAEAVQMLDRLQRLSSSGAYVSPYWLAVIYTGLGDRDRAFSALQDACEERPWELVNVKVDPLLDRLRGDPRFESILRRLRLPT